MSEVDWGCKRVAKWFMPCKWTVIMNRKGPSAELRRKIDEAWEIQLPFAKLMMETETYAGSMCLICGKFIKPETTDEQ